MPKKSDYRKLNKLLSAEIDYKVLGRHMKSARKQRKLTQAEMAEEMKLGVKYYAALEAGTAKISLVRFIQFVCIIQVSADSLLIGTHEHYPTNFLSRSSTQHGSAYTKHEELHSLIDKCSDDKIETMLGIMKVLKDK